MKELLNGIILGDSLDVLKTLPSESINCCVTSPPYYGLRDYGTGRWIGGNPLCPHRRMSKYSKKTITGHKQTELVGNVGDAIYHSVCPLCGAKREDKQIGLEDTPDEYIKKLVVVFSEVKRVLKSNGTLWLNIGDSYWGSGSRGYDFTNKLKEASKLQSSNKGTQNLSNIPKLVEKQKSGIKNKDLIGIPWMLAFALRNDGWYLRQDIIWHKPNPMPESVKDRCTKSHEYLFLLSKNAHYYFDKKSIEEEANSKYANRYNSKFNTGKTQLTPYAHNNQPNTEGFKKYTGKRNKRDVWTINVRPIKEAHFAIFPEELVKPCILAGTKKCDIVLDPFCGSGTTGKVAHSLNREFLGIELNPEYAKLAEKRISETQITFE